MRANDSAGNRTASRADAGKRFGPEPHRFALLRRMRANDSAGNRTASRADAGKRFGPEPHRFTLLRPDAGK
jgi:hypothetical protein